MSNPSSSPPVSWISGTSGFEEAGQRLPKREEAEDPARMDEADALAERLRIALERVEEPAEGLGGVHGIEHHALFPCHPDQERELAVVDGGPSRALVAVEEMNGLGHFEGESVAAHGLADGLHGVGADGLGGPRDRHAYDLRRQADELLAHEEPRLAASAEAAMATVSKRGAPCSICPASSTAHSR